MCYNALRKTKQNCDSFSPARPQRHEAWSIAFPPDPGTGAGYGLLCVGECFAIATKELQINEEIRDKEVRLIGEGGEQLGIVSTRNAMEMALEKNLDLVKIAPQAAPPVCRIMDYGKYRFEQAKRDKEARKNQKVTEIKEIRLSLNIDTHDFETKVGHAKRFLTSGDKVKVSIRFRGREMAHANLGNDIMKRFAEACAEFVSVERVPKLEGRSMIMFLNAKPAK